jgi:hypothetical protein
LRILLGTLLRLGLGPYSEDCSLTGRSCGGLRLAVVNWRKVGIGGVWTRIICDRSGVFGG